MQLLDHLSITVRNLSQVRPFYLAVMSALDAVADPRRHCCLRARSTAQVRAFHAAGLAHGGKSDGAPGLRAYHAEYYAAFLLDPEGNKIEAVFHHGTADARST